MDNHSIIFTVDLDRDYPIQQKGRLEATSGMNLASNLETKATIAGLIRLLDIFEKHSLRVSFFCEASVLQVISLEHKDVLHRLMKHELGCHGFAHEDLTGEGSGYIPKIDEVVKVLKQARNSIKKLVGTPKMFRAPYLHISNEILDKLPSVGFSIDSSITVKQADSLQPYKISPELLEIPLSSGKDSQGKVISGYLWQFHEGNRQLSDYEYFISKQSKNPKIQYSMLATHPWHLYYHTGTKSFKQQKQIEGEVSVLDQYVERFQDRIVSIDQFLSNSS